MLIFIVMRSQKLVSRSDPFFSMTTLAENEQRIEVGQLNFMFAIERPDASIGEVVLEYGQFDKSAEQTRLFTEMELVDCAEMLPGGKYEGMQNSKQFDFVGTMAE